MGAGLGIGNPDEHSPHRPRQENAVRLPELLHHVGAMWARRGKGSLLEGTSHQAAHSGLVDIPQRRDPFPISPEHVVQPKTSAPFWKREQTAQGAQWLGTKQSDVERAQRWNEDQSGNEPGAKR